MATISDVSRLAGVSTATVSRVINRPELVEAATRETVLQAIKTLRYRPNEVARGLASRSSRTIGIVVNLFGSKYYGLMLDGAVQALREQGFHTLVEASGESRDGELRAWESLMSRQCDGLIMHSDQLSDQQLVRLFEDSTNSVLMNRYLPAHANRCVYLDNTLGGQTAAQYLLSFGHTRIAMLTGPQAFFEVQQRQSGFMQVLECAATPIPPELILESSSFVREGGLQGTRALLASAPPFTALFCHSDEMAAGALEACAQAGMRVPQDISIIGFDDVDVAHYVTPQLTTVRQPLAAIGDASARLAHALATGDHATAKQVPKVFEPRIVERATVARVER